jgi:hypothetical protein
MNFLLRLAPRLGFEHRFTSQRKSHVKHVCFGCSAVVLHDLFCKTDSNHPLCGVAKKNVGCAHLPTSCALSAPPQPHSATIAERTLTHPRSFGLLAREPVARTSFVPHSSRPENSPLNCDILMLSRAIAVARRCGGVERRVVLDKVP